MIGTIIKWFVILGVIVLYLVAAPTVETLPFGAETALQTASNFLNAFLNLFRFVRPIFTYAFYILLIETLLFGWKWFKTVIGWL